MTEDSIAPYFIGTWIALLIAGAIFHFSASPDLKAKTHIPIVIGGMVLFVSFMVLMSDPKMLLFAALPIAAITYLNIHSVRYCRACGKMNFDQSWRTPKFCQKCGADLAAQTKAG